MPLNISNWAIAEKNKLVQTTCWVLVLEITIPTDPDRNHGNSTEIVRVVSDNKNLVWQGYTWQAFPFEIDEIGENSKGEIPRVEIRISNISRVFEYYLQEYDYFLKTNGFSPITVRIMVVNTGNLSNPVPEVSYDFDLQQPKTNALWATFSLGVSSPYRRRFPEYRILKNHCQYPRYKGPECRSTSTELDCDRTFTDCRLRNNSPRFGGFPGAGGSALRV